ncbi:DUF1987 domain-containing protein [Parvicella tangerina]|uniref:SiaC family regulatory phosphoprotein domain-containing protein n=1 Tax=Parvicella tangerina TaxID=2829795 RepID=A0A916JM92_9FLAO|nr:DUF1987 domain-containing protein [Parvicella tangerina]CAG5082533.1 hypothetical protein CRYO30217_01943 [Parvicella tangerina]
MNNIFIDKAVKTPLISFDFDKGVFKIEGVSVPENTVEFYNPIVYALKEYVENPKDKTVFDIKLEYFNTSTSVILLNIFRVLSNLSKDKLTINWYYEEEDLEMLEAGEDYGNMVNATFNIIAVDSFD